MTAQHILRQGETSSIVKTYPAFGSTPVGAAGTVCTMSVFNADGTQVLTRGVTDTVVEGGITKFLIYLTPGETTQLPPGCYDWVYQFVNTSTSPPFNKETIMNLQVTADFID